jgi:hypothetical protein
MEKNGSKKINSAGKRGSRGPFVIPERLEGTKYVEKFGCIRNKQDWKNEKYYFLFMT